ncbi:MAG: hypothetical protein H0U70_08690 [Tatlockia sp.]|nr:hypothetical protein [Tatlockia sp.]
MKGVKILGKKHFDRIKTRWSAWLALFILALIYEALPTIFYWGPHGLLLAFVSLLTIPMIVAHWRESYRLNRMLVLTVNGLITLYIIISISRLVLAALEGQIGPNHLLVSSVLLWIANIFLFALWYWDLDAGGPRKRELKEKINITAFLFPQAQIALTENSLLLSNSIKNWEPKFIDYLFLAFNTSTAFSPTDTPILARWAKCLTMVQALLSLTIILMLAARAVNILSSEGNYLVS